MTRVKVNTFPEPTWFELRPKDVAHLDPSKNKTNSRQLVRFILSWMALLGDSPFHEDRPTPREARSFFRTLLANGVKATILELVDTGNRLVSEIFTSPDGAATTGPAIRSLLKSPVSRTYIRLLKSQDMSLVAYLLTFLWFGKKLPWDDPTFSTIAFRKWADVEEKLSDLVLPESLTIRMRNIVSSFGLELDATQFWPKHGPGMVVEGTRDPHLKSMYLGWNSKLDRAFKHGYYAQVERLGDVGRLILHRLDDDAPRQADPDIAEFELVPKDIRTARTICKETSKRMLLQQGVMRSLTSSFRRSCLRHHVCLEDQGGNRDYASLGSAVNYFDTIDLSSASDSVSIDLVRKIFPRQILYYLLATRSSKVRISTSDIDGVEEGTIIQVKKFAPMGSALCFPVQCVVFSAAIVLATIAKMAPHTPPSDYTYAEYKRLGGSDFKVYGDDIVCDSRVSRTLVHVLEALGFSVNTKKSFLGTQAFRESCGKFCIGGVDVTPYIYKIANRSLSDASGYFSHIEHVNLVGDMGYRNLQRFLHSYIPESKDKRVRSIYYTSDRSQAFALFSSSPRNNHLQRQPNLDWQLGEVYRTLPVPREKKDYRNNYVADEYLYLRWWATRIEEYNQEYGTPASRLVPVDNRLDRVWTPDRE